MKKIIALLLASIVIAAFTLFALGSSSSEENAEPAESEIAKAEKDPAKNDIADCTVEIQSCRLARDWEGKAVVIVKYAFTNNGDKAKSFMFAFEDAAFQNVIGLSESYILDDSADNQTKEIQKGATLEVKAAYELNGTAADITVEVSELFSFNDTKISKTLSIV